MWLCSVVAGLALTMLGSSARAQGFSLRTFGNGTGDIDRVKIRVDDPSNALPGPPADLGASDFTIEFWVRGTTAENTAGAIACGANVAWINGNVVVDRDRFNQDRKFGVSFGAGRLAFGVSGAGTGDRTICGTELVLDGAWHHVAVARRRSDGRMWIWTDGVLDAEDDGPDGDLSYPDAGVPGDFCNGPCTNSDPFLVLAAEKHDAGSEFPSFAGWFDEVRLSAALRYLAPFARPTTPFVSDAQTAALYHLDEGTGDTIGDSSGAVGGPSPGERRFGGDPAGPLWSTETPFVPLATGLDFFTVEPCRALDSRLSTPLVSESARMVPLAGTCGVPPGAVVVSVNLTAVAPSALGHLSFGSEVGTIGGSVLNFGAGQTRANQAIVSLGAGGSAAFRAFVAGGGQVDLLVDVNGYFQ